MTIMNTIKPIRDAVVGGKQGESGKRKNEIVSFLYYYFYQSSFTESVVGVDEYNYFTSRDGYRIKLISE